MMKIILISTIFFLFFVGCDTEPPTYSAEVVYLKTPESINIDGKDFTRVEFAVADLKNRVGDIKIVINGKETILKNRYFSPSGTIFTTDIETTLNTKFDIKFDVTVDEDTTTTTFNDLELNSEESTENFNVKLLFFNNNEGEIEKTSKAKVNFGNFSQELSPTNGELILENLTPKRYFLKVEGVAEKDGFYHSADFDSILLDRTTTLYFNLIYTDNRYYDEELISCNYQNSSNTSTLIFLFISLFLFFIRRKEVK